MPIIKFVNESEKIEYPTEQDVCSLLCYAFAPQKTIMNDNQFVGCKPFGFPFWYMRNPLAVHQFMETSVYKGYKQDKIEMRGDRAEMSDFPLYLNTVAGGLDRRDQTIGGFSFVVKIYAVPVVEIIG